MFDNNYLFSWSLSAHETMSSGIVFSPPVFIPNINSKFSKLFIIYFNSYLITDTFLVHLSARE